MKIKYLSILPVIAVLVLSGASLARAQVFTENLYYGLQNNPQVSQLQEFLTSQNLYSGPITGNFYFLTLGAVKAFQTQQGITPAAGYFGPVTMAAVNKIADAAVGASNNEAITETGTSTPPIQISQTSSSPQSQLGILMQEVSLLEQQLATQQSSTQTQTIVPLATSTPPAFDACKNIQGIQATVPPGMYGDGNGNCLPLPVYTPAPTPTTQNVPPVQTQSQQTSNTPEASSNNAPSCILTGTIQSLDTPPGAATFDGANVNLSWTFANMPYSSTTPGTIDEWGISNGALAEGHKLPISAGTTNMVFGFEPIYKVSFSNAVASVVCYAFFPDYWTNSSTLPNVGDVSVPVEPYAYKQFNLP